MCPGNAFQYLHFADLLLFPQRLTLPSFSGHPHCGRVNDRILGKQCLDVLREGVCRIDGVEPVGDVAEVGIEFIGKNSPVSNPWECCSSWQYGHDRETAVPWLSEK